MGKHNVIAAAAAAAAASTCGTADEAAAAAAATTARAGDDFAAARACSRSRRLLPGILRCQCRRFRRFRRRGPAAGAAAFPVNPHSAAELLRPASSGVAPTILSHGVRPPAALRSSAQSRLRWWQEVRAAAYPDSPATQAGGRAAPGTARRIRCGLAGPWDGQYTAAAAISSTR